MTLLLVHKNGSKKVIMNGLQAIGGAKSSGVSFDFLKAKDDYAIVSCQKEKIQVHNLKSKNSSVAELSHLQSLIIEDLTLVAIQESGAGAKASMQGVRDLVSLLQIFEKDGNFQEGLDQILVSLCNDLSLQFGFVVVRNLTGEFDVASVYGLNKNDRWLSESLIQEVLDQKKKVFIQNIVGSKYQNNKTLVNSGFLSLFAVPLVYQGKILGVFVIGSRLPHEGLSEDQEALLDLSTCVSSLLLQHYLKEERFRIEMEKVKKTSVRKAIMTTQDPKMLQTLGLAEKVAKTGISILLQGETGVGKELLAQSIHRRSDRAQGPFVAINCGAIPSELLESLLFGHKRGAFTGAVADQVGHFQKADGGTLFLDEVADLPLSLQVKLLRVLQERKVEPLGSQRPIAVDVRILAASCKNLSQLVEAGSFRSDLYFRLAEVTLTIPSLHERIEDVMLLADEFLKREGQGKKISREAMTWLCTQQWPGNVRELHSTLRRAAILSQNNELEVEDFLLGRPEGISLQDSSSDDWLGGKTLDEARDCFIKSKVRLALIRAEGKRAKAAELLGVTPRTLFRYLDDMNEGPSV